MYDCKTFKFNNVLSIPDVIALLKKLHEQYVFVPTDKASNNITVVCKKFYLNRIRQEFSSSAFSPVDSSVKAILEYHEKFLSKHGIEIDSYVYIYINPQAA